MRPTKLSNADSRTPSLPVWMRRTDAGVVLALHVQPGARRSEIVGEHGQRLKIALQAPPVDGRANEALLCFLGERLGLRRSALRLSAGASSREKSVAILVDDPSACAQIALRLSRSAR